MGFINASLSTHVKTPKPKCQSVNKQTNERTNNTHTHISTAIDRQTDLQPTKKMKMMLPATKVLVSVLAFSACLSQTARVSFASTITPFQDVEGGLAGVGQDLVSEFGGGIQVESRFDDQGLLEGTVSEEDFLDSSAGGRNLQADFGDAANVAKDILKIVTGAKTIGQDIADAPKYGRRNLQADFGDAANVAKDILKITTGIKTIGQDIADAPKYGRKLQADFGDAANVAKDILKITTGAKTIGQ